MNNLNESIQNSDNKATKKDKNVFFKAYSLSNYNLDFLAFLERYLPKKVYSVLKFLGLDLVLLKYAVLILLIVVFASPLFVSVPINQEEKAISIFLFSIGILCAVLVLYTLVYVKVKVNNDSIELKGQKYQFSDMDIVFCENIFNRHIEIFLENDAREPSIKLYLDEDQMDFVEEFYLAYFFFFFKDKKIRYKQSQSNLKNKF